MNSKDYYLLVFESRNHILYLQSSLEAKGQNYFQLVSAPCGLKSGYGCNYALKITNKNYFSMGGCCRGSFEEKSIFLSSGG